MTIRHIPRTDPKRRSAFERAFVRTDPRYWPFVESFGRGGLVYPTEGCNFSEWRHDAIWRIAKEQGDPMVYLSITEGAEFEHNDPEGPDHRDPMRLTGHWELRDASYEEHFGLHLTEENCLYPPSGRWGVMFSQEWYALVAGEERFMTALTRSYPGFFTGREALIREDADPPGTPWLLDLMAHVDG